MVEATKHSMKYKDPVKEHVELCNICKLKIGQLLEMIKCRGKAWFGIHISLEKEESFLPCAFYIPLFPGWKFELCLVAVGKEEILLQQGVLLVHLIKLI